jgi:SAM-dependent methyltransferase
MPKQDHFWSASTKDYEKAFIDPYAAGVRGNPVKKVLHRLRGRDAVADLGCGIGPLLPFLSRRYKAVYAVDFAEGMLKRAKQRVRGAANVNFVRASLTDLCDVPPVDVAVAVNSLLQPNLDDLEASLREVRRILKPEGWFLGIVPAMDAVHYMTMLMLDRARAVGLPPAAARKNAAHHADHALFDFAFSEFRYLGTQQHFWQPAEVGYRFKRAGLVLKRLKKVHLAWNQLTADKSLHELPAPWDWFFLARPKE